MITIESLSAAQAEKLLPQFVELLRNSVHNGASVGFMPPLSVDLASDYWRHVFAEVAASQRVLLIASEDDQLAGSVQLAFVEKQNALHRAAVEKLVVHTNFRRRGIGARLLAELENVAREGSRSLLVLDTERGSDAENLYRKCGYISSGVIPHYALTTSGSFCDTVVFYKLL